MVQVNASPIKLETAAKLFLDRDAVLKYISAKERKALGFIGAAVRRTARSSIRKRKRRPKRGRRAIASAPGRPPIAWESPGLREIIFTLDPAAKSVIIGPMALNRSRLHGSSAKTVPELLSEGGYTTITESRYSDRPMPWHPGTWRKNPVERRQRRVRIAARPFMGPAVEANQRLILDAFED